MFLAAQLRLRRPDLRVTVRTGLYGDCLGTLRCPVRSELDGVAVVLEWADFDPRLGVRALGGWSRATAADIFATASARAAEFEQAIADVADETPALLSLPTLPLPPISHVSPLRYDGFSLRLRDRVNRVAVRLAEAANVKLVNPQLLDRCSPPAERLDVRSEVVSGFPYRVPHASIVGELLASLILPHLPKKGLITDLDDTVWRGLVGEIGPENVSWDLHHRSHMHALYQQFLASLAEAGVLIGVASKNDPARVEEVFRRDDLLLPKQYVYPLEVAWGPKSQSVARILAAWNVGPDSVVFVDDSPMELAEVKARHPDVECLLFPRQDEQAIYALIEQLRALFGKDIISAEDSLRLDSLRSQGAPPRPAADGHGTSVFLQGAEAQLTVSFRKEPLEPRALELINKTNQFNLHGRRYTEGAWQAYTRDPEVLLLQVSYKDKYGPLGTIAVITGRRRGATLAVENWVMSCRAFARRIEHRCTALLFEKFDVGELTFAFEPTPRNKPLQDYFAELMGRPPEAGFRLAKDCFAKSCPPLHHRLKELAND
jgi:FkbH-like protein